MAETKGEIATKNSPTSNVALARIHRCPWSDVPGVGDLKDGIIGDWPFRYASVSLPLEAVDSLPDTERRDLLGGLVHEYIRAA